MERLTLRSLRTALMCTGVMGRTEDGTLGLALRQFSVDRKLKSEVVSDEFWSPCHTMVCLTLATGGRWGVVLSF